MRTLTQLLGAGALVVGIGFLAWALATPYLFYNLNSAQSALQITQIYSEATFRALIGIGGILTAIFFAVTHSSQTNEDYLIYIGKSLNTPKS